MIWGCVKPDRRIEKQQGKREVNRRSDGRQELRSCIRSRMSQAANGVHLAVLSYGLAFVSSKGVTVLPFWLMPLSFQLLLQHQRKKTGRNTRICTEQSSRNVTHTLEASGSCRFSRRVNSSKLQKHTRLRCRILRMLLYIVSVDLKKTRANCCWWWWWHGGKMTTWFLLRNGSESRSLILIRAGRANALKQ